MSRAGKTPQRQSEGCSRTMRAWRVSVLVTSYASQDVVTARSELAGGGGPNACRGTRDDNEAFWRRGHRPGPLSNWSALMGKVVPVSCSDSSHRRCAFSTLRVLRARLTSAGVPRAPIRSLGPT